MRTALPDVLIIFPGAQHPIQPHRQLVGNRHLGHTVMLGRRQAQILPMPARVVPLRRARRLHQQPAQQRVALLADVSQTALVGAGILRRNQPQTGVPGDWSSSLGWR